MIRLVRHEARNPTNGPGEVWLQAGSLTGRPPIRQTKMNFHPAQAAGVDQFDIGACGRLCLMFLGLPQPDDLPEVTAQADATAAHDQRQVAVACCAGRTVLPASSTM